MHPIDESKWIQGLEPGMSVADAARHVLSLRLQAVAVRLGPALHQADDDAEHVHQLRVSTRRAGAALRIFADCLPAKDYRKARRLLRRVRRTAGQVRDWDVFLEGLAGRSARIAADQRPGLDFIFGFGAGQRSSALARLRLDSQKSETAVERMREDTLAALGAPAHHALLGDLARHTLGELLQDLCTAASQDLHDYDHLHRVRIFGKRLRYAMEVFSSCFPKDFRGRIYAAIEEMQEMLGQANDSHIASQHLDALRTTLLKTQARGWERWRPGVERLLQYHQRRLLQQRRKFMTWWDKWHGSRVETSLRQMLKVH